MTIPIHPQSVDKLAINLSDEPDEEQSSEQLDVIHQVAASLSDEQRDPFFHRHFGTPADSGPCGYSNKGKGIDSVIEAPLASLIRSLAPVPKEN